MSWVQAQQGRTLVVDIEAQGHPKIVHPTASDLLCVGMHNGEETVIVPRSVLGVPDRLVRVGETDTMPFPEMWDALAATKIVGHNTAYDVTVLGHWLKHELAPLPIYADTMMSAYALWPATKMAELSLSSLCARLFGFEDWSLGDYSDMWSYDEHTLYKYCSMDVEATWRLHGALWSSVQKHPDRKKTMDTIIVPFLNMLADIEPHGVSFDREYVTEELIPTLEKEAGEALVKLREEADKTQPEGGWPRKKNAELSKPGKPVYETEFNPSSPKQVLQVLQARGHEVPTTDKESLKLVSKKGDAFAGELLRYRGALKNLGTYARTALTINEESMHPFDNSRIFPKYNIFGTLTGRTSSSNPNIQNQPKTKQMRRMYTASAPDRRLVECDYSQAELRVMAALSEDEWLAGIFADPTVDIFDQMMPSAFPNEEYIKDSERGNKLRRDLKTVIYGLSFGRSIGAIAHALGMSYTDAEALVTNFLTSAHRLADWRKDVIAALHDGRGLTTRFGRYFHQDVITVKNRQAIERSGLSFLPQSSSSDCCLLAAIRTHKWIAENGRDWKFMAMVHDAINLDVPEEEVDEAASVVQGFLVEAGQEYFPEVTWAAACGSAWSWDAT